MIASIKVWQSVVSQIFGLFSPRKLGKMGHPFWGLHIFQMGGPTTNQITNEHMDVSKNRGTPKFMVYNGKPLFWMDDLGVALFLEPPQKTLFLSVVYKWYSPCQLGDDIYHRSHLLREPVGATPLKWTSSFLSLPNGSSLSADVSVHQKLSGTESQRTPRWKLR